MSKNLTPAQKARRDNPVLYFVIYTIFAILFTLFWTWLLHTPLEDVLGHTIPFNSLWAVVIVAFMLVRGAQK